MTFIIQIYLKVRHPSIDATTPEFLFSMDIYNYIGINYILNKCGN
jgi:hypothetical protein